ncbi:glutathione S-transferase domain-containing protein [Xylariaceae sp. FL0255]|nr:glutathione S-transferase domain-containing protein [Xylariaceae sp. FL0255]
MAAATPKLRLYTNHGCPWAHRAHIALAELNVPFEEEIIDLSKPRTAEYLKVNPRGLVPSLKVGDDIITESAVVAGYLADAYPSHLLPPTGDAKAALQRAQLAFFVDTYMSKVNGNFHQLVSATVNSEETAPIVQKMADAIAKEVEPLLANAAPFFNGSDKLTLAEVLTGSFIVRLWKLPEFGVVPENLLNDLTARAPNFGRWAEAVASHPSVTAVFDAPAVAERTKQRLLKK